MDYKSFPLSVRNCCFEPFYSLCKAYIPQSHSVKISIYDVYFSSIGRSLKTTKSHKKKCTSREIQAAAASPAPTEPPTHDVGHEIIEHKITKMPGNAVKRCVAPHDRRVRTRHECRACDHPLCVTCFATYHKKNQ